LRALRRTRYVAVDRTGRKIELAAERQHDSTTARQHDSTTARQHDSTPRFGLVSVVSVKASPAEELVDRAVLRERLAVFLKAQRVQVDEGATLEQVLRVAVDKAGFTD
jgi:hypothetical protein